MAVPGACPIDRPTHQFQADLVMTPGGVYPELQPNMWRRIVGGSDVIPGIGNYGATGVPADHGMPVGMGSGLVVVTLQIRQRTRPGGVIEIFNGGAQFGQFGQIRPG